MKKWLVMVLWCLLAPHVFSAAAGDDASCIDLGVMVILTSEIIPEGDLPLDPHYFSYKYNLVDKETFVPLLEQAIYAAMQEAEPPLRGKSSIFGMPITPPRGRVSSADGVSQPVLALKDFHLTHPLKEKELIDPNVFWEFLYSYQPKWRNALKKSPNYKDISFLKHTFLVHITADVEMASDED